MFKKNIKSSNQQLIIESDNPSIIYFSINDTIKFTLYFSEEEKSIFVKSFKLEDRIHLENFLLLKTQTMNFQLEAISGLLLEAIEREIGYIDIHRNIYLMTMKVFHIFFSKLSLHDIKLFSTVHYLRESKKVIITIFDGIVYICFEYKKPRRKKRKGFVAITCKESFILTYFNEPIKELFNEKQFILYLYQEWDNVMKKTITNRIEKSMLLALSCFDIIEEC